MHYRTAISKKTFKKTPTDLFRLKAVFLGGWEKKKKTNHTTTKNPNKTHVHESEYIKEDIASI